MACIVVLSKEIEVCTVLLLTVLLHPVLGTVLMAGDEPTPPRPQQQHDQGLAAQSSRSAFGAGPGLQQQPQAEPYQQQQQQLQPQFQQQMPFGMLQQASQGMFDVQQRNQMLYEALQLKDHQPVNHAADHELTR